MRALVLEAPGEALRVAEIAEPEPSDGQILIRVRACAVCRTDLHIVDGELARPKLPLVLGHQIVGTVERAGRRFRAGTRVGVPWLAWTDGDCPYCLSGRENLCESARFTGYDVDGGYAEYTVADERFCLPLPDGYTDEHAAPLLCAGLIGYRALRRAGAGSPLGLYGFGSSAHLIIQVALAEGRRVFVFTRPGDSEAQEFARSLGAEWAGGSDEAPPDALESSIIFAPVGALLPEALSRTARGGTVVSAGIHMSDIPSFSYELLWEERALTSVANLTRRDGEEFLGIAPGVPVRTAIETFSLEEANAALERLRAGELRGSAVLKVASE